MRPQQVRIRISIPEDKDVRLLIQADSMTSDLGIYSPT